MKTIDLTGQGVTPDIAVNPETISFGNVLVGTPDSLSIKVYNQGNGNLLIQGITVSDPAYTIGEFDLTIVPGDSTIIPVIFSPLSTGDFPSQIDIMSNDTLLVVPISGTGVAPAISITPDNLNFGYVHISEDSTLTLNIQN